MAELIESAQRILQPFLDESQPGGGIDAAKSPWQKPGRGAAAGSDMFPGGIDIRYLRYLVEVLYRLAHISGRSEYRRVAASHVRYLAGAIREEHPSWALGTALEAIGVHRLFNAPDADLIEAAERMIGWAFKRKVRITTVDGVSFDHFPCGYKVLAAKDAGWTNDLSLLGSGLVWACSLLERKDLLDAAGSFSEFFLQPWKPEALGPDGYWQCGSWREDLGCWVIGPAHYSGFESTDAFADESAWIFSALTCTDFLSRLHSVRPDPRLPDFCMRAAEWTFENCQFSDGAIGFCGRDDKWLGATGAAITQVALLKRLVDPESPRFRNVLQKARESYCYLSDTLSGARIEDHGVEWVNRTTSVEPLVNVAMLWQTCLLGLLSGRELW